MKIADNKQVRNRMTELFQVQAMNKAVDKYVLQSVNRSIKFNDYADIEKKAEIFRKQMEEYNTHYTADESLIGAALMEHIYGNMEENEEFPFPTMIVDGMIRNSRIFHEGEIENNPYLRNIHFERQSIGEFELSSNSYAKYELFQYDEPLFLHGTGIPKLAMFDHRFRFPRIRQNKKVWMSITPNEIYSMAKPIDEANGKVLTLGCGMGYFAYMASRKPDVEHITIIEKEQAVIDLFTSVILPQFENKDKITIVHEDAIEYLKTVEDGEFDYCFADIWAGSNDILPYIQTRKICDSFNMIQMSYWIDRPMRETISIIAFSFIDFVCSSGTNGDIPSELISPEFFDQKVRPLVGILKDMEINTAEDLDKAIDSDNLISALSLEE